MFSCLIQQLYVGGQDPVVQLVVSTNAVVKFINAPLNFIVTLNLLFNTSLYLTHR